MSTSIDLTSLSRQINEVGREIINNLGNQIDGVQANLGTVRNDLQLTRSELADLREEFQQFVEEAARVATVQQSQVKIVDLKAQLEIFFINRVRSPRKNNSFRVHFFNFVNRNLVIM